MLGFVSPRKLREQGILSINQRNADFIMRYNPRHLFPLVDNKLLTKELAIKAGIAVPELYGVIEIEHHIRHMESLLQQHGELVVKPANGSGGNGILVIDGHMGRMYRKASGDLISLDNIKHHTSNILSGMYSLGGMTDKAILEYRVQFDPLFEHVSFQGVPDVRVIVFRGVPVASMIRLPTRESDGKANLHQGAMGIGIDLATGITNYGVCNNKPLTYHPDTGHSTCDIAIPHWDKIMSLAIKCADTVGLGYLGVDIVMDRNLGPLMLELNARPGLNVQLANKQGLLGKLQQVQAIEKLPTSVEDRIVLARNFENVKPAKGENQNSNSASLLESTQKLPGSNA